MGNQEPQIQHAELLKELMTSKFDALNLRLDAMNSIQEERRKNFDVLFHNLTSDMWGEGGKAGLKMDVDRLKIAEQARLDSDKSRKQITFGTISALILLIIKEFWNVVIGVKAP